MKKILLIHDLLSSPIDPVVTELVKHLKGVHILLPELPVDRQSAMEKLRKICTEEHPLLIVGLESGAALAQLFYEYERVLISPDYDFSKLLKNFLQGEESARMPYLGMRIDGEMDLQITQQLVAAWEEAELHQFDGVCSSREPAHGLFWINRNERNVKVHQAHYGDACYLPGEGCRDEKSQRCIAGLIHSLLEEKEDSTL